MVEESHDTFRLSELGNRFLIIIHQRIYSLDLIVFVCMNDFSVVLFLHAELKASPW